MNPPDLPIRTERLLLRPAHPDDVDDGLAYWGDPEVTRFLPFPALDRTGVFRRIARFLGCTDPQGTGDALFLMIELDGRVVGDVMLRLGAGDPVGVAELGWVLHPSYAGQGIAFEAAGEMKRLALEHYGCHRLEAHLDPRNERSAALAMRLGMTQDGLFRKAWPHHTGEWLDTAIYGLVVDAG